MAVDVEIPGMGESVSEVILIEWLKADGDSVERDEPICVLETDKANVDLPAPETGVLRHVKEIDATLELAFDCPGFVFAVGNHIPSNVPVDNALFMFDYLSERWDR